MPVDKPRALDFNQSLVMTVMPYWKTYFRSLLRIGAPLYVLMVTGTWVNQWLTGRMQDLLMDPQGTSPVVWLYGALSLVWGSVYPLVALLLILWSLKEEKFLAFWSQAFPQALIEMMRAWGKSILWSFLLIIPGIIRAIQYLFVPLIVVMDPKYNQGEREALVHSRTLTRGRFWNLAGIFVLINLVVPVLLTAFDEWQIFSLHPVSALAISFLETLLNIALSLWILKIYLRSAQT